MTQHENKNALKHGLFAEAVILPGENEEEFKALHDSVVEEWNPEGPIEEDAAMNITNVLWRKRRFERFRKKKVEVLLEKQADNKKQRAREDEKMKEIIAALNSGAFTDDDILKKLGPAWAEHFRFKIPRHTYRNENIWMVALRSEITTLLDKRSKQDTHLEDTLSDEKLVSREADMDERMDAMLDKSIKRLGQTKTMKSMGLAGVRSMPSGVLKQVKALPPLIESGKSN